MVIGMKLLIQPRDGIAPVIAAIKKAKKSIEIVIFRFDRDDIERALHAAVARGVKVHALIAHTNQGGAGRLRKLEQRLLGAGATVDRTGDDFVRYHGKFMIVDRTTLLVLGFNYTLARHPQEPQLRHRDDEPRRPCRTPSSCSTPTARGSRTSPAGALVVSPENARAQLAAFLGKARKQLLIYDPKISDPRIINVLKERAKAGVDDPDHRQGELARRRTWSIRSIRDIGFTCAPSSATGGTRSSAARVCASSSWTNGAKWACSSRDDDRGGADRDVRGRLGADPPRRAGGRADGNLGSRGPCLITRTLF